MNQQLSTVLVLGCCALAGCGKHEVGAVRGTVTFKGEVVPEGMLIFKNQTTETSFTANLDAQGKYALAEGTAIPVGKYKVTVLPPFSGAAAGPKKYQNIPQRYRDQKTTDLEVEVAGQGVEFNIEMKP